MAKLFWILSPGIALLGIAAGPAAPVRVIAGDAVVSATVADVPARLLIEPGAPSLPILNPAFAARAGLKKGLFGARFKVGPVAVAGTSAVHDLALYGARFKRRFAWFDRPIAPGVDGMIGPGTLPDAVVRFDLRQATASDRTVAVPMVDGGGLLGGWEGLFGLIEVGGSPVRVRFDLHHRMTVATAGAGNTVANALGGRLEGATEQVEVAFGIARPVRRLRLARPLTIGPFALSELGVRVSDYGNAGNIPDADSVPDPDEIVVTGKAKKRDRARDQIRLGRDRLDACASIVFDKPAKLIRLTCS